MFVSLYHHLGFQAPETAAPTSLLCAECSMLEAGGSLLGWNRHQVELSPFDLRFWLVSVPRTTHWVLRVREDREVHFGDEIPGNPCYCPWVGAKFCYEKCLILTALHGADSLFWVAIMSYVETCFMLSSKYSQKGLGMSSVSHGSLELVCANSCWPNVYLRASPTSPLKIPFSRKMFIQITEEGNVRWILTKVNLVYW